MNKQIEQIYTKIDKLLEGEAPAHDQQCEFSDGYFTGLSAALNIIDDLIDSLQDEQPSKDLEEEIKAYFQGYWPGLETAEQCNTNMQFTPPAIMRLAKHFYGLGQASMLENTDKNLEEAAEKYANSIAQSDSQRIYCKDDFLAGAQWQKEQMMKDAVDGEVVKIFPEGAASIHYQAPCGIGEMAYFCKAEALKDGDKVKVIIVKDGDKVKVIIVKEDEK